MTGIIAMRKPKQERNVQELMLKEINYQEVKNNNI